MDLINHDNEEDKKEYSVNIYGDFMVLPVTFYDRNAEEENETLGIEREVFTVEGFMSVNVNNIGAFYPVVDNEGDILDESIMFISGHDFRIRLPYHVIQSFISQWIDKNDPQTP